MTGTTPKISDAAVSQTGGDSHFLGGEGGLMDTNKNPRRRWDRTWRTILNSLRAALIIVELIDQLWHH